MELKHLIIPLLALLLASVAVSASFTNEWGEYQDDETNRGFVADDTGNWNETGIFTTINEGSNFQPLGFDADNDGTKEIIGSDGNFLKIWGFSGTTISPIDEKNMGFPQKVMMSAIENFDSDSYIEFIAIFGNNITVFEYNGTSINTELTNITVTDAVTGIRCGNFSGAFVCYWGNNGGNITQFNLTSGTFVEFNISSSDIFATRFSNSTSPAMDDIDRDGNQEIIFMCDPAADGNEGICVVDENTKALDTLFSGDGILHFGGTTPKITGLMAYNVDGSGDTEIISTHINLAANRPSNITVYNSDGSERWTKLTVTESVGASAISNPIIQDFVGGSDFEICAISQVQNGGNSLTNLQCFDDDDGTRNFNWNSSIGANNWRMLFHQATFTFMGTITSASMDHQDNSKFDIVVGGAIISLTSSSTLKLINFTTTIDEGLSQNILVDVNNDSNLDVCAQRSGQIFCALSSFINQVPTLNNTQNFGGYGGNLDYTTPICVGSTLTFSAQETGGIALGNYDNDGSEDQERIVSNCGQLASGAAGTDFGTNLANGTFAWVSPSFQCVYNVTGIFSVRLFLQDNFNDDDFTEYNTQTITVQVINGTAGITCNLGTAVSPGDTGGITPSAQESQTNEAVEDTLGILFGTGAGSDKLKLIVGIALILGIIAAAYREGVNSGAGVLVVAGFATLLVTFIGLITPAIFILGFAFVIFIIFIGRAVVGGGAPNGGP